tara:strand:+ start:9552 stop:10241 length:690 start_codon:yes stop_codon:yes gene_type:complete
MNKILSLFLVAFTITINPIFAQQYSENTAEEILNFTTRAKTINLDNTNGSPFENEEFVLGSILSENNILISNIYLRYNAYQDEFQIKQNPNAGDDKIQAIKKSTEFYVKMGDEIFTYKLPQDGMGGYYNILVEGNKVDLLKKISKKFVEGQKSVTMMTGNHPNRLIDESSYVVAKDDKIIEVTGSKNKILEAIAGDQKNELKKYTKSENLNVKKEDEMIKAVNYYNENL